MTTFRSDDGRELDEEDVREKLELKRSSRTVRPALCYYYYYHHHHHHYLGGAAAVWEKLGLKRSSRSARAML